MVQSPGRRRVLALPFFLGAPALLAAAPSLMKRVVWLTPPAPPAGGLSRVGSYPDRIRAHFVKRGLMEGRDIELTFEELSGDPVDSEIEGRLDRVLAREPAVVAAPALGYLLPYLHRLQKRALNTPIVFYHALSDPVALGFVESLSRPGRNMTGTMLAAENTALKQWELLKQVAPDLKRGGFLLTREALDAMTRDPRAAQAWEKRVDGRKPIRDGLGIEVIDIVIPTDAPRAAIAQAVASARVQALMVRLPRLPPAVMEFLRTTRVPAIVNNFGWVRDGALMGTSYSHEDSEAYAVEAIRRILGGESPATIPVYISREFVIAINSRTARANGIKIPNALLLRANEVVQ